MVGSDGAAVVRCCRELATFSEEQGRLTRTFLSPPMRDVHRTLTAAMTAIGMAVRVDAAGNLRGVLAPDAPRRIMIGSHLDTVRDAGAFDGILGVVMGIALARRMKDRALPFGIEVVGFSEEEGVRFGVPFIGSRALAGTLDDALLTRTDGQGIGVDEAIRSYGLDPGQLDSARLPQGVMAYLEFHIEQGPVLDAASEPVAVVSAIAGQTRMLVTFTGAANHAGTTPMIMRRDALAGAAEWIASVEEEGRATAGLVATVGVVDVEPGAGNVVPGRCRASLDVRHEDDRIRHDAVARLTARARAIAERRGLDASIDPRLDQAAVPMDETLRALLRDAALSLGMPARLMVSGAGHDAMILAPVVPSAMLFLRTPGGLSHHPDEALREEDVDTALAVGERFLATLAERTDV